MSKCPVQKLNYFHKEIMKNGTILILLLEVDTKSYEITIRSFMKISQATIFCFLADVKMTHNRNCIFPQ